MIVDGHMHQMHLSVVVRHGKNICYVSIGKVISVLLNTWMLFDYLMMSEEMKLSALATTLVAHA